MDAKKIFKNFFNLSIAEFMGKGLNAIFFLYLTNKLGSENFGILGTATAFVSFFTLFTVQGFDVVGQREISRNNSNTKQTVNNLTSIKLISFSISFIAFLIAIQLSNFSGVEKLVVLIAGTNILSLGFILNWVYQALERNKIIAIRSLIIGLINVVGVLVFVNDKNDVIPAIMIMVSSFLINTIWMTFFYIKDIGPIKLTFNKALWKKFIVASFSIGISFLLVTIYNNLDILMLRKMLDSDIALSSVGIYNAAHRILVLSLVPSSIVQTAFFPQLSKLKNRNEDSLIVRRYILFSTLIGAFVAGNMFIFSDLIATLIGDGFEQVSILLKLMSITVLIIFILQGYYMTLLIFDQEKKLAIANFLGLIFNAGMNFLLIPIYAEIGAAYATIAGEIGVLIVSLILFKKITGRLYPLFITKIILISAIAVIPAFVANHYGFNPILVFIICLISFISFVFLFKLIKYSEIKELLKR